MQQGALTLVKDETMAVGTFLSSLVDVGYLKKEDAFPLKAKYSKIEDLYDALASFGTIPAERLAEIFAKAVGVPFVNLKSIDPKAIELIDKDVAKKYGFVPFYYDENIKLLQVALLDPIKFSRLDQSSVQALEQKLGLNIEFFIAPRSVSEKAIDSGVVTPPANDGEIKPMPIRFDASSIKEEILKKIPLDIAEKYKAIIFQTGENGAYDVAVADTKNPGLNEIFKFVEQKSGIKLNLVLADSRDIDAALNRYKALNQSPQAIPPVEEKPAPVSTESTKSILDLASQSHSDTESKMNQISASAGKNDSTMENPDLAKFLQKDNVTIDDLKMFTNTGQIPQAVAAILFLAVTNRASDIHIEPYEKAVRVRFRIDGELSEVILIPSSLSAGVVARVKILAKLKIDEQRVPQDGRIDVLVKNEAVDVRISTLPTVFGEKIVMRLLSKSKTLEKLEDLGIDGLAYDRIVRAMNRPYGVILSTGPTGSGKSTTLYSILSRLNQPQTNIVTLEDPVEYEIQGINQVQVKPQIGFGFADGLRSVLRQDPNIIMVGEIRDKETADLATQAALTGHLVLSTLHTNNSAGALPRLSDLGVEPFLLTSAINAVAGQRLVRRICPKCREEVSVPQSVMIEVKKQFEKINFSHQMQFFKGRGCENCKNGFKGRVGIFEVLEMSSEIENMLLNHKSSEEIFAQATKEGMISMRQDGLIKAVKGLTTVDEVLRATSETKEG